MYSARFAFCTCLIISLIQSQNGGVWWCNFARPLSSHISLKLDVSTDYDELALDSVKPAIISDWFFSNSSQCWPQVKKRTESTNYYFKMLLFQRSIPFSRSMTTWNWGFMCALGTFGFFTQSILIKESSPNHYMYMYFIVNIIIIIIIVFRGWK